MKNLLLLFCIFIIAFSCKKKQVIEDPKESFKNFGFNGVSNLTTFNSINTDELNKTILTNEKGYFYIDSSGNKYDENKILNNYASNYISNQFTANNTYFYPSIVNGECGVCFKNTLNGNSSSFTLSKLNLVDSNLGTNFNMTYYSYGVIRNRNNHIGMQIHYMLKDTIKFLYFEEQNSNGYKLKQSISIYQPFAVSNSNSQYFNVEYGFLIYNQYSNGTLKYIDYFSKVFDSINNVTNIIPIDDDNYIITTNSGKTYSFNEGNGKFLPNETYNNVIDFCTLNGDTVLQLKKNSLDLVSRKTNLVLKTISISGIDTKEFSNDWKVFYNNNIIFVYDKNFNNSHRLFTAKKKIIYQ